MFFLAAAIVGITLPGNAANAPGSAAYQTTPLLIIRFNQRQVNVEKALYTAVSAAADAKAGVRFRVVNHVPAGGEERAERNLSRVLSVMQEMGVPQKRITVERQEDGAVESDEVHVFAQ